MVDRRDAGVDRLAVARAPALLELRALARRERPGQQLVRYYGTFSNACRGSPGSAPSAPAPPAAAQGMHQDASDSAQLARERRRSWARLIRRVYEAHRLVCPRCSEPLKIISQIGDRPVIEKILRHSKLRDRPERPPAPDTLRILA